MQRLTYYANWDHPRYKVTDLPIDQISHLVYCFLDVSAKTGRVSLSSKWVDLEATDFDHPPLPDLPYKGALNQLTRIKRENPALKTLLAVGGGAETESGEAFKAILTSRRKCRHFVASLATLIETYGFDGADIDFEFPDTVAQGYLLTKHLLRPLRERLPAQQYLITADIPSTNWHGQWYDAIGLYENTDWVNLMTYDYFGSWSLTTGHHSNLLSQSLHDPANVGLSIQEAITYWADRGIPPSHMQIAIALYGYCFTIKEGADPLKKGLHVPYEKMAVNGTGVVPLTEIVATMMNSSDTEEHFDAMSQAAYLYNEKRRLFVSLDSADTAKRKAKFAMHYNLAGISAWKLSGDLPGNASLWRAISDTLGPIHRTTDFTHSLPIFNDTSQLDVSLPTVGAAQVHPFSAALSMLTGLFVMVKGYKSANSTA